MAVTGPGAGSSASPPRLHPRHPQALGAGPLWLASPPLSGSGGPPRRPHVSGAQLTSPFPWHLRASLCLPPPLDEPGTPGFSACAVGGGSGLSLRWGSPWRRQVWGRRSQVQLPLETLLITSMTQETRQRASSKCYLPGSAGCDNRGVGSESLCLSRGHGASSCCQRLAHKEFLTGAR